MTLGRSRGQRGEIALLSVIILVAVVFCVSLSGVSFEARLFPLLVLGILLGLSTIKLALLFRKRRSQDAGNSEILATSQAVEMPALYVWTWVVATVAAIVCLGALVGTALSILGYLLVIRREKPVLSFAIAATVVVIIFLVFGDIMRIDVRTGLLLH